MKHIRLAIILSLALGCGGGDEAHAGHDEHAGHAEAAEATEGSAHEGHPTGHATGHEGHTPMAAGAPASDTSLFQLTTAFTDQAGQSFTFESLRGHPTLVVMFYGSCETVCPILLRDVKAIDDALDDAQRARTRVLLVTFDPENDTAEGLTALASENGYDTSRWSLLRGEEAGIRELSMVLGVQYRRLPDGNYSHSALITLLNPAGEIVERIEGLGADTDAMLAALRAFPAAD